MLHVAYRAVNGLASGRLVEIDEDRGRLDVRMDSRAPLEDVVLELTDRMRELMAKEHWFQIWRGRVLGPEDRRLEVAFEVDRRVGRHMGVNVREGEGYVRFHVSPEITVEELARALNANVRELLAGRQWFQWWDGEIITMDDSAEAA
ncbi:hypothetical protein [Streptomyces sp. MJP52]|uniref:hypothetical protein n=1 Tax=Streptomyces sp. MJP52 TaxID=2940555 RepID=UPI00247663E6|nr:hypothetical protein [Streptomyces sp. MJP52]MDH6224294.1 hypothetical protein [Streptomyces sp. MJP52]